MPEVNKKDIATVFRFLQHDEYTELRAISPDSGLLAQKWVETKEEFLNFCEEYDGEANVYVGVNPRSSKGGSGENIDKITTIPIDIDAITPWEKTEKKEHKAATDEELTKAKKAAKKIITDFEEMGFVKPLKIMSGNGVQLWYRIPEVDKEENPEFEEKVKEFIRKLKKRYTHKYRDDNKENENFCPGVDIDQVGDAARIMKVAGTKSVKGLDTSERPMRRAKIIGEPDYVKDGDLCDFIKDLEVTKEEDRELELGNEEDLEYWRKMNPKLDDLLNGDWADQGYESRSEAEFTTILLLLKYGFNEESIEAIMSDECDIGKWNTESDNYRGRTINNAMNVLEEIERIHNIKLRDMCADHVDEHVETKVQIVGNIDKKAMPKRLSIFCTDCGLSDILDLRYEEEILKAFLFGGSRRKKGEIKTYFNALSECEDGTHSPVWDIVEYMDYSILFVRDIQESSDIFEDAIFKERYVHLIDEEIPEAKVSKLRGKVKVDDEDNLVILSMHAKDAEDEISNFTLTEEDKEDFEKYFNDLEEIKYNIAPGMVGRDNLRISRLLTLHSVVEIPDIEDTRKLRGNINEVLIGDSKVYKSQSFHDVSNSYKLGKIVMGETSSRTGLLYTIDTEKSSLIWGALPQYDRKYLALDGMHCLPQEEISQFREAITQQRVEVQRLKKGSAKARTRVSVSANPRNPVSDYMHPCNALMDSKIFNEPPDVTRYDIFLVLAENDVTDNEIATRKTKEKNIPTEVFKRHILWAWNLECEDIIYQDETKDLIIEKTQELIEEFSISELPVVHSGAREVLTRLSVGMAVLLHSVDEDHKKVLVKPEHVNKVYDFYRETLSDIELDIYKDYIEGEKRITDDELSNLMSQLDDIDIKILDVVKYDYKTSQEICEEIDSGRSTIENRKTNLKAHNLIETDRLKGSKITPKGINLFKKISKGDVARVENLMEELKNICPVDRYILETKFGEDKIRELIDAGTLKENEDGKLDVDIKHKFTF